MASIRATASMDDVTRSASPDYRHAQELQRQLEAAASITEPLRPRRKIAINWPALASRSNRNGVTKDRLLLWGKRRRDHDRAQWKAGARFAPVFFAPRCQTPRSTLTLDGMTPRAAALERAVQAAEESLERSRLTVERVQRQLQALQAELAREAERDPHPSPEAMKRIWHCRK